MPLIAPNLDIRSFDQLVREAQLRVQRYSKQYTDFNESDPGMTLIQMFAWFTESLLHEMNRVPDLNYVKFLQLLGLELTPAQPAEAHLTFYPQENANRYDPVPKFTQVAGEDPESKELVVFETEAPLDMITAPLDRIQVWDGSSFTAHDPEGGPFRPFGFMPQVANALYLGFKTPDSLPDPVPNPFPQDIRLRVFRPEAAGAVQSARDLKAGTAAPVNLAWEYRAGDPPRWRELTLFSDETAAFTRSGYIQLLGPRQVAPSPDGREGELRYWLRCRIVSGSYPGGREPVVERIRPNTVPARSLSTAGEELLGVSDGSPDQRFDLRRRPVLPDTLGLEVRPVEGSPEAWTRRRDFLGSGPDDAHYVLNPAAGQIRMGDGKWGRIPVAGSDIVALGYRYGGGAKVNLVAGAINLPLSAGLAGIERVANERPAVGGKDEQPLDELKRRAPSRLRNRNRAVTGEDFGQLALDAGGLARAHALPLSHPDFPGVEVPGAVTVIVIPDFDPANAIGPPEPSEDLLRHVARHLDRHRVITTEVFVAPPKYITVKVGAFVTPEPSRSFEEVRRSVVKRLNAFLDPIERGFGETIRPWRLMTEIQADEGVANVNKLWLRVDDKDHNFDDDVVLPEQAVVWGDRSHDIRLDPGAR